MDNEQAKMWTSALHELRGAAAKLGLSEGMLAILETPERELTVATSPFAWTTRLSGVQGLPHPAFKRIVAHARAGSATTRMLTWMRCGPWRC